MSRITKQGLITKKIDDRTTVVETFRMRIHPLYKKRFKVIKKYLADDKGNNFNEGDIVIIEETKPISKKKRFMIKEKVGEKHLVKKEELKGEEILEAKESKEEVEEKKEESKKKEEPKNKDQEEKEKIEEKE